MRGVGYQKRVAVVIYMIYHKVSESLTSLVMFKIFQELYEFNTPLVYLLFTYSNTFCSFFSFRFEIISNFHAQALEKSYQKTSYFLICGLCCRLTITRVISSDKRSNEINADYLILSQINERRERARLSLEATAGRIVQIDLIKQNKNPDK